MAPSLQTEKPLNTPRQTAPAAKPKKTRGLRYWMERVLDECDQARADFAADPVHDLRVAMRRCRSMADGLMVIDPDKSWKTMKKGAKPLFQALGELRDNQVMEEVVQGLGSPDDVVVKCVLDYAKSREHELKSTALAAVEGFDRKAWRGWSKELPRRAARIRQGSIVFRHMALERWTDARGLQAPALRSRSPMSLHRLRIGLKRLRYTVENFLPQLHDAWIDDLKELQNLLGEVHDLDVLWAKMIELRAFPDEEIRLHWRDVITDARNQRIEKYRHKMLGPHSLWTVWRAELPNGPEVRKAGLERLRMWASFLDPDVPHSRHVAHLALKIYDGLELCQPRQAGNHESAREILRASALVHDVGRGKSEKGHHKRSFNKICKLDPPLGWSREELALVAAVTRYHRGALPQSRHRAIAALPTDRRKTALHLAAVLRLANVFDCDPGSVIPQLQVQMKDGFILINAKGYMPRSAMGEQLAGARHLLELVCNRPIIIRPLK